MLIPNVYYLTGSFFHYDAIKRPQQITTHLCQIFAAYLFDTALAVSLIVLGVFAFSNFAHNALTSLPLSIKVTLILGGGGVIAIDTIFLIYRGVKVKSEMHKRLHQMEKKVIDEEDSLNSRLTEETHRSSKLIQELEEIHKQYEDFLKEANVLVKTLEESSSYEGKEQKLKEAISWQLEIKEAMHTAQLQMDNLKVGITNALIYQEKREKGKEELLAKLQNLKKKYQLYR